MNAKQIGRLAKALELLQKAAEEVAGEDGSGLPEHLSRAITSTEELLKAEID